MPSTALISQAGRRAQTRALRVDEITSVALELVAEGGLDALTIHALAKRMGWAVGALYRYFPSKAALYAALELSAIAQCQARLAAVIASRAEAPGESASAGALGTLLRMAGAYEAMAVEAPAPFLFINLLLAEPQNVLSREEAAPVLSAMFGLLDTVAARFRVAAEVGALAPGDAAERAFLYWAGVRSVIQLKKLEAHDPRVRSATLVLGMAGALLSGWGARPADLTAALGRAAARGVGA